MCGERGHVMVIGSQRQNRGLREGVTRAVEIGVGRDGPGHVSVVKLDAFEVGAASKERVVENAKGLEGSLLCLVPSGVLACGHADSSPLWSHRVTGCPACPGFG